MKLRPQKQDGPPDGGPDDIGALLASNDGFPLLPPQLEPRRKAQLLYWIGWRLVDIAEVLGLPEGTIAAWKSRGKWDESSTLARCEGAIEAQFIALVLKQKKSGQDFKEIDLLGRQLERGARIRRFQEKDGHEGDLNPKVANRNKGEKAKPVRNRITPDQASTTSTAMSERMRARRKLSPAD